ncbi:hypothetical protein Tco_0557143 [Tanacetum coccineum]
MGKGLLGPKGGSCGGKGGRGGSMVGRGGDGRNGIGGGEVNGRGVDLGVFKSLLGEIPGDVMGERGGDAVTPRLTQTTILSALSAGSRLCFCGPRLRLPAFLADTYSTSAVEMARAVFFLENHEVKKLPMNVHTSLVLLRST